MKVPYREFKKGADASIARRFGAQGSCSLENAVSHSHPDPEFCLVTAGFSRFIISGCIHSLYPGSLVWLPAGQSHVLIDQSRDHRMLIASFRRNFVKRHADSDCSANLLGPEASSKALARKIPQDKALLLEKMILELDTLAPQDPFVSAGFKFLFGLAWKAFASSEEDSARKETHPAVEKALGLLMKGKGENLNELAKFAGLSPSALCRLFKSQIGVSIVDYKNKLKVARFIELYGKGRKSNMTEAAYQAGFGSYAQFYRIFTELTGLSPRAYRKQIED